MRRMESRKIASDCNFKFQGFKIDLKIIMVKENQIAGIYTFYSTPCTQGCEFDLHKCKLTPVSTGKNTNQGYSTSTDDKAVQDFAKYITNKIVGEMKE
jgi:hypothetical protein